MLQFVLIFLVLAIIAGLLGFSGVAIISVGVAKILFFIFLALLVFSFLAHVLGYGKRPPIR